MINRPKIVCLCGSTRFMDAFEEAARRETLAGKIVLTIHGGGQEIHGTPLKRKMDELHLHRITMADEILVLNVGGYVGSSTRNEIDFARLFGKKVRWWEHNIPLWKKALNKIRGKLQ